MCACLILQLGGQSFLFLSFVDGRKNVVSLVTLRASNLQFEMRTHSFTYIHMQVCMLNNICTHTYIRMHVCRQVTLTRQTPFNGVFNSASLSFTRSVNAAVVSCVHADNDAGEQTRANADCQTVSTAVSLAPLLLLLLLLRPFTRELVDWQRQLLRAADVVLFSFFFN